MKKTQFPKGYTLQYIEFPRGGQPQEIHEQVVSIADAERRARELKLTRFTVWHSDGVHAVASRVSWAGDREAIIAGAQRLRRSPGSGFSP
jgi:hypothetical protein